MLQRCVLTILAALSLQAFAGNFDFLPTNSGPEKEFRSLLESGDYRHALMAWESSQRDSAFAQSNTGVATWSFLLYQNGMAYTGLETLMESTQPSKIDPRLLKLWVVEIRNSPLMQRGWIASTGGWKNVLNNEPVEIRLDKAADINAAFARAERLPKDNVNEKARIWWQIATRAPLISKIDSSLRALKLLRESGQTVIGQDLIWMTQGRVLYQKGELPAALEAYQQIPKSSSLWLESIEETSWTHLRQGDYDRAMGDITTVLSPVLAGYAGPESFFLANLMAYRVCDYSRVFNNSEIFKTRHRNRLNEIQELASKGNNKGLNPVFDRFDANGVTPETAGPLIESLPRGIFRDSQFVRLMESRRLLLSESKKASELFEDSKTLGGDVRLERALNENRLKADRFRQTALQRVRFLAQSDVKEYRMTLNKMHIIEGEVIQRLNMDDNLKGERSKLTKTEDSGDVLVFPYTKEVWMDELGNYKARVKDCPTLKGASL